MKERLLGLMLSILMMLSLIIPAVAAAETASPATAEADVVTDAELAAKLGILQGEGSGLTAEYLGKQTTRIQAAILFLRLKGLEQTAIAFEETANFEDASLVWEEGQRILAYLKANPELGWSGTGENRFDPMAVITTEQFTKVVLEVLGYKQDQDFEYGKVLEAAAKVGVTAGIPGKQLQNVDIASGLVNALNAKPKGMDKTLGAMISAGNPAAAEALKALQYGKLEFAAKPDIGAYLTDGEGRALYYFSKDAADLNSCQGACLTAWPVFFSEKLRVPAHLSKKDFGVLTRADGTKQTTYQGWPLYYYAEDAKAGDTNGDAFKNVWFLIEGSSFTALASKADVGSYLTDSQGMSLYYFDKDTEGFSACSGACEANWPVFYGESLKAPTGVKESDFGVLIRADGSKQTTYKGFPLYYYVKDMKRGDTAGQGFNKVWHLVDPAAFKGTPAANYEVKLGSSTEHGAFLTDSSGMALYTFAKDAEDLQSCQGKCLDNWPVFHADAITVSPELKAEDFGVLERKDGTKQTTYKGWPLYYFIKDTAAGQTAGQNVNKVWFLASPEKTEVLKPVKTYTIDIAQFKFSIPELTIEAGSKVTFTNFDTAKHNAVAVDGSWGTKLLEKGESETVTFDKPGVYDYVCEPHKRNMKGVIIVK